MAVKDPKRDGYYLFRLRLPEPLANAIYTRAWESRRSLNAEITVMLAEVLGMSPQEAGLAAPEPETRPRLRGRPRGSIYADVQWLKPDVPLKGGAFERMEPAPMPTPKGGLRKAYKDVDEAMLDFDDAPDLRPGDAALAAIKSLSAEEIAALSALAKKLAGEAGRPVKKTAPATKATVKKSTVKKKA
jgi:hypothetical protein